MQTKWIDDLLAIAETKNFSRAAEMRCITQSALSRRIKSLEEWVGVELVDRGTYPVQLTLAGQTFCNEGREALSAFMDLRSSLRRGERMPGRSIQVVAGHTLSMTFVPKWFTQFQQRNGYFTARVLAANVQEAVIALAEGGCDLMIGYSHPRAPILLDPDKFVGLRLGTDAFFPVSAPGADGKPLFALSGSPHQPIPYLSYTATSFLGRVVDLILHGQPVQPDLQRFYEADMAMHLMRMAREGYGITWLPESAVEEEIAAGKLVRAGGPEWAAELEIWSFRSIGNTNQTMIELWKSLERDVP
ncbi:LysR substrate-binding domain-containing protein [Pseudomonas sp. DTU_2021_1001937_2_SI_NGA_ILE_001]|uniref:LysR substrate-binding domain-containing protein n=1 Tax=Pseudomonas sp. DTU_2021_1001937_2_SI_NGA_ILE_001 TaxID=3077589 RepID=UPI0028FC2F69|nr:LysR substrate-binding domain-containing protein [Pseudomonas sp. DTU_2021_1001937_2_SI_NGA_ILE_001]WNW10385.1 LysR substrate-binding domain-containing protein [Pseudomonas sp. DTU_2021_1001937_2_SI_NGA_ILE_001]